MSVPKIEEYLVHDASLTCIIKQWNNILQDIQTTGHSSYCPCWDCVTCAEQFPLIKIHISCPCYLYSKKYLIKRIKQIIAEYKKQEKQK